jgi:hypothetical protein
MQHPRRRWRHECSGRSDSFCMPQVANPTDQDSGCSQPSVAKALEHTAHSCHLLSRRGLRPARNRHVVHVLVVGLPHWPGLSDYRNTFNFAFNNFEKNSCAL